MTSMTDGATAPLTAETVGWAYRLLLGRDPESPEVIEQWRGVGLERLRHDMLRSPEFQGRVAAGQAERSVASWAVGPAAVEAMLVLRDGHAPAPAEVERRLRAGADLDALRRELFAGEAVRAMLPPREGLRSRALRLLDWEGTLLGDTRDPDFTGAPAPAPAVAAALRALWPDGAKGVPLVDSGAGIGLITLAMAAALPGHGGLRCFEERLREAAFLAANLAGNGIADASPYAVAAPPAAELVAAPQGAPGLLRLGAAGAVGEALAAREALAASGCAVLLRFDPRAVMLLDREDPRRALALLAESFPGAAALDDPAEPTPLAEEAARDRVLDASLRAPLELVLAPDPGWIGRFRLM
ncbi:hypothetical protein [Sabulicella glaciei]|uniref:Uncharacterized protein n=1 Tax=Sabulicella glaciei TaxID=2984948 RepID=A0ABT3NV09_9PROT|nr:hypothetical protein [Roseococcus sp. MDT2-1-1]MCW8085994.1 hypothetical protein [Roseococcus sp. MDT2-1-1]